MLDKEISVVHYERKTHGEDLKRWLHLHGKTDTHYLELPEMGWVGCFEGSPVAMGFLRRCEGSVAIFDPLISNPEKLPGHRHAVLDGLVSEMLKEAKELGFLKILGWSHSENTLIRAEKHGFTRLKGEELIAIRL